MESFEENFNSKTESLLENLKNSLKKIIMQQEQELEKMHKN